MRRLAVNATTATGNGNLVFLDRSKFRRDRLFMSARPTTHFSHEQALDFRDKLDEAIEQIWGDDAYLR